MATGKDDDRIDGSEGEPMDSTSYHVRGALAGSEKSTEWIYNRFYPLLHFQATHRLGPSAGRINPEDVVQDTWLKFLERRHDFEASGSRSTPYVVKYLSTINLNRANELLSKAAKRQKKEQQAGPGDRSDDQARPLDEYSAGVTGPGTRAVRNESVARVLAALEELDGSDREILLLCIIEQLSHENVARLLNTSRNNVATRKLRALKKLREKLGPGSIFDEL